LSTKKNLPQALLSASSAQNKKRGAEENSLHSHFKLAHKSCAQLAEDGRRRWKIESQGLIIQKNHGFHLGRLFSKNCDAMKKNIGPAYKYGI
jgi:hypothetical protein